MKRKQLPIDDLFRQVQAQQSPMPRRFVIARRRFRDRQIRFMNDVMVHYESFSRTEKFVALCLFSLCEFSDAESLLLKVMLERDALLAGTAAAALSSVGTKELLLRLESLLRAHNNLDVQTRVFYAISHLKGQVRLTSIVAVLARAAKTSDFHRTIRANAISELAYYYTKTHSSFIKRRIRATLTGLLQDESAAIRKKASVAQRRLRN